MIFDNVNNRSIYYPIDPRIAKAFEFYSAFDPATPAGVRELDGKDFYVLILKPEKRDLAGAKLEVHRKYIDLQIVVSGSKVAGYAHASMLNRETDPYNDEKDAQFFAAPEGMSRIVAPTGSFFLFWPQDGHAPCCDDGKPGQLTMLTFKLKI